MKKKVILITAAALVLLSLFFAAFLVITSGRSYVSEGILQNDLVKIKNVRFENGTVYYTLVNDSRNTVYYGEKPHVEKLINEEWVSFPLYGTCNSFSYHLGPFSEKELSFAVHVNTDRLEGKYRLTFGDVRAETDESGVSRLQFDAQETYIVGHLEITEEQSPTTTPEYVYYDNGVKKHKQVDVTASIVGGVEPKLLLSLTNNSEKPLVLQLPYLSVSRYQGYFHQISGPDYYMYQLDENVTVAPGETLTLERVIYSERYAMKPIDPPSTGRYCVNIPYYFEGATETESEDIGITPRDVYYANHKFDHFD